MKVIYIEDCMHCPFHRRWGNLKYCEKHRIKLEAKDYPKIPNCCKLEDIVNKVN